MGICQDCVKDHSDSGKACGLNFATRFIFSFIFFGSNLGILVPN